MLEKIIDKLDSWHLFILMLVPICFIGFIAIRGVVVRRGELEINTNPQNKK